MALNLSYKPEVLVSTENMDEETWKRWRKKGIGGSDVAAVLNISPFRTKRDLYYDKTDTKNAISDDEDNWVAKQVGHLLEDLVAKIFAKKTGYRIWQEKKMFYHPLYPFMLADIDYKFETEDRKVGILECKSAHYLAKEKWVDGRIPIHYEYQVRHYMAVNNINVAYIACLFGNNESDFIFYKIERDLDIEEMLINEEMAFWNDCVLTKNPPEYVESADLALESIRKHFGSADVNLPEIALDSKHVGLLRTYIQLREEKSRAEKRVKELKMNLANLSVPFAELMGQSCNAKCTVGNVDYLISYSPRYDTRIKKDKLTLFKDENPELYDKYVTTTESRIFSVKAVNAS